MLNLWLIAELCRANKWTQNSISEALCESCSSQLRFMSDLDFQSVGAFDPFADANTDDSGAGTKEYVHVRIQQRNGRKSLTTVQGLKKEYNYNKILKDFKKEFCCNGTVVQDSELGQVIQLQGDQRKNVSQFLVQAGLVKKDNIKIHGFWDRMIFNVGGVVTLDLWLLRGSAGIVCFQKEQGYILKLKVF